MTAERLLLALQQVASQKPTAEVYCTENEKNGYRWEIKAVRYVAETNKVQIILIDEE